MQRSKRSSSLTDPKGKENPSMITSSTLLESLLRSGSLIVVTTIKLFFGKYNFLNNPCRTFCFIQRREIRRFTFHVLSCFVCLSIAYGFMDFYNVVRNTTYDWQFIVYHGNICAFTATTRSEYVPFCCVFFMTALCMFRLPQFLAIILAFAVRLQPCTSAHKPRFMQFVEPINFVTSQTFSSKQQKLIQLQRTILADRRGEVEILGKL